MGFFDSLFRTPSKKPTTHTLQFPERLLIQNWRQISEKVANKFVRNEWNNEKYNTKYTPVGTFNAMLNALESQSSYEDRMKNRFENQWSDPRYRYNKQKDYYNRGRQEVKTQGKSKIFCVWPIDISGNTIPVYIDSSEWNQYEKAAEFFKSNISDIQIVNDITPERLYIANFILYSQVSNPYNDKTVFELYVYEADRRRVTRIKPIKLYPYDAFFALVDSNGKIENAEEFKKEVKEQPFVETKVSIILANEIIWPTSSQWLDYICTELSKSGKLVTLSRDKNNIWDKNAIKVLCGYQLIGYLPRKLAEILAPKMDEGEKFIAQVNDMKKEIEKYSTKVKDIVIQIKFDSKSSEKDCLLFEATQNENEFNKEFDVKFDNIKVVFLKSYLERKGYWVPIKKGTIFTLEKNSEDNSIHLIQDIGGMDDGILHQSISKSIAALVDMGAEFKAYVLDIIADDENNLEVSLSIRNKEYFGSINYYEYITK
ncbi:hypothetical protein JOC70_000255 [Clostridium pascui]|uniref:HIRAN domain-containing protein n=1 Tax=Clostridium pascui TaxID=46609 RepID=UPI00195EFE9B|nr:HIRAN domain-containing protein [Clostridium pascui]MBM7868786.1 hypothetical protein [Clostridium pascui]